MYVTIHYDLNDTQVFTSEEKAMFERVLGTLAGAVVEAMKPELNTLRDQVNQANAVRDQKAKDYEVVNERRIVLENENASLIADQSRLREERDVLIAERDAAKAEVRKWENEVEVLIKENDAIIAKVKAERDVIREERDRIAQKLGSIATRLHDTMLLLN